MASYMAKVELHQAVADDYQMLHGAMERRGFARTIRGSDGVIYQLPTGTYDVADTSATVQQALEAAEGAAAETKKKYSAIVSMRTVASWNGLAKNG